MDKVIPCHQLFLMKNIEIKKLYVLFWFMCFCHDLKRLPHTLNAFF